MRSDAFKEVMRGDSVSGSMIRFVMEAGTVERMIAIRVLSVFVECDCDCRVFRWGWVG